MKASEIRNKTLTSWRAPRLVARTKDYRRQRISRRLGGTTYGPSF